MAIKEKPSKKQLYLPLPLKKAKKHRVFHLKLSVAFLFFSEAGIYSIKKRKMEMLGIEIFVIPYLPMAKSFDTSSLESFLKSNDKKIPHFFFDRVPCYCVALLY